MNDLNTSAQLIEQEIASFEEKMREHQFHVNQLRNLLVRMSADTGEVKRVRSTAEERINVAQQVADLVRQNNCTKITALRALARAGAIPHTEVTKFQSQMSHAHLGDAHDTIFKGTKYVSKD